MEFRYDSPLGPLGIELDAQRRLHRISYGTRSTSKLPRGHEVAKALDTYFRSGNGLEALDVALDLTPFQESVLRATRQIPAGETRTYSWVAQRIGKPRAARAVGQALGANPIPIVIPCHRVVSAGALGGYTGGINKKKRLLELERTAA